MTSLSVSYLMVSLVTNLLYESSLYSMDDSLVELEALRICFGGKASVICLNFITGSVVGVGYAFLVGISARFAC